MAVYEQTFAIFQGELQPAAELGPERLDLVEVDKGRFACPQKAAAAQPLLQFVQAQGRFVHRACGIEEHLFVGRVRIQEVRRIQQEGTALPHAGELLLEGPQAGDEPGGGAVQRGAPQGDGNFGQGWVLDDFDAHGVPPHIGCW